MTDTPPLLATAGPFRNPPAYVAGPHDSERVITFSRLPGAEQLNVPDHTAASTSSKHLDNDHRSYHTVVSPSHLVDGHQHHPEEVVPPPP